jgi:hypothetical protein
MNYSFIDEAFTEKKILPEDNYSIEYDDTEVSSVTKDNSIKPEEIIVMKKQDKKSNNLSSIIIFILLFLLIIK